MLPLCAGGGLFWPCEIPLNAVNHDVVVGTTLEELNKSELVTEYEGDEWASSLCFNGLECLVGLLLNPLLDGETLLW